MRVRSVISGVGLAALMWTAAPAADVLPLVDDAPTGAIKPQPLPHAPRLDLALPAGFSADLPPEAPPPAVAPSPAEALAADIHAALDRFVAAPEQGRPIGAGDWKAARTAIAAVYAERAYAPLWLDGDHWNAAARAALARLARAREDGLDLALTPPPADSDPQAKADAEIALSAAVVAYAMQASGARLNPRALSKDVTPKVEVADPAFALKSVAAAPDADAALEAFNPPQPGYRALREALAAERGEAPAPVAKFSPGPILKLGMTDPRVPLIRARFGLGAQNDAATAEVYDIRVASAVAAFQRVHGLPVNGALTEATASALDGFSAHARREDLLLANMEMWRWQPRDMGETRVEVNVPDFTVRLMRGEDVVWKSRVIVGKPDTPTPIFSNSIKYMLFNPVWRVPESIIKKEMEPHAASDPDYFARHGYKVSYVGDRMVVEQPPGEANALGRMLFLFPNEHAVYLHDTPQRGLFASGFRAYSHGCVRVEDPAKLAELLTGWSGARVRGYLGDKERTVGLPAPVPIHIQYFTEIADESGRIDERRDVYGLTAKVAFALAKLRRD
jgi:murein L,D-transpeptidase YcbB/YkuD